MDERQARIDAVLNRMAAKHAAASYNHMPLSQYTEAAVRVMFEVAAEYIIDNVERTTDENHTEKHTDRDCPHT